MLGTETRFAVCKTNSLHRHIIAPACFLHALRKINMYYTCKHMYICRGVQTSDTQETTHQELNLDLLHAKANAVICWAVSPTSGIYFFGWLLFYLLKCSLGLERWYCRWGACLACSWPKAPPNRTKQSSSFNFNLLCFWWNLIFLPLSYWGGSFQTVHKGLLGNTPIRALSKGAFGCCWDSGFVPGTTWSQWTLGANPLHCCVWLKASPTPDLKRKSLGPER